MDASRKSIEQRLAGEQQVLTRSLRSLIRRDPVVCPPSASVRDTARLLHAESVGSVVVVDAGQRPEGIFTTADLVAAMAQGLDASPVGELMRRNPIALPADAMAYEAALLMVAHRIRHVLVTEEGRLAGLVSERDLFSLQHLGLGDITTEIRAAAGIEVLAVIAGEIRRLARLLVEQGVAPEPLTHFVSVLNDRLCARVIELVRRQHAWDGVSWAWIAFGSEGRLEQTFSTDQDNGVIFAAHDARTPEEVRALLVPFARGVNEALDACGFLLCKGNIMGSNPKLCLSLTEWQARMSSWIETPEPKALLDACICFDFRTLFGDAGLVSGLRDWLLPRAQANRAFLRHMAENALTARPPLATFRDFVTEDAPQAANTIDLKRYGVRPFIDAARVYALAHGRPETNTAQRLRAAGAAMAMPEREVSAMVGGFHALQRLRLRAQAAGVPAERANRVDPAALDELERAILRESFRQARTLQERLALDFQL